jgi:hypothetical protein
MDMHRLSCRANSEMPMVFPSVSGVTQKFNILQLPEK